MSSAEHPEIRPDIVTDAHLDYLDKLRESGRTNMFGAPAFIQRKFRMSFADACKVCSYWMATFPRQSSGAATTKVLP